MKSIIQQIKEQTRTEEKQKAAAMQEELANPATSSASRETLKKAAFGGLALGGLMKMTIEDTLAPTTSRVNRSSAPSDLSITEMRYCVTRVLGRTAIIRIDTNQGIYG